MHLCAYVNIANIAVPILLNSGKHYPEHWKQQFRHFDNFPQPPTVLEKIHWWHMCSTSSGPGRLLPQASEHYRPCIQFTMEESDRQLPFLDILLSQEENGSISTSVHRKATHTDQYLCFLSHHPASHKRAVVYQVFLFNLGSHWPVATVSGTQKEKQKKYTYTEQMLIREKRKKRKMNTKMVIYK